MKRHSLLFGVEDYPGTGSLTPLSAPGADVDALLEVVSDPRYMGEVGKVRPYKDLRLAEARERFGEFFEGIDPEDVVLIYFSGHGLRDLDAVGHLYLCFTDTDESKLDLTAQRATEIGDWLDRRGFRRTLIVLDCCYSGAAGAQLTKGGITAQLQAIEQPHADGTGRYVLSSSGGATVSMEKKGLARSVFTHHLIEGITSGAADTDRDGKISVAEISGYLSDKVPKDAIGQLPELSSRKTSGTFIVAHNLKVVEERERQRAAEVAAERARERAALAGAVVAKLREHVNFGSIDMDFAGGVQSWLDGHPTEAVDHPRLALLREFSEGRLSAIKFHDRWRGADAPQGRPAPAPDPAPVWRRGGAEASAAPSPRVPEPEPRAPVEPEPVRAASSAAAGGAAGEMRRAVPAGADPSRAAALGRAIGGGRWWRAGLVALSYFVAAGAVDAVGAGGLAVYLLQGVLAGAVAWWLFPAARWSGFFLSLLALIAAHAAHVVVVHYGGEPGWYLADLVDYPEYHVRDYMLGTGGFVIGWLLLAVLRRGGRRSRSV